MSQLNLARITLWISLPYRRFPGMLRDEGANYVASTNDAVPESANIMAYVVATWFGEIFYLLDGYELSFQESLVRSVRRHYDPMKAR